jgi:hypothetical protein
MTDGRRVDLLQDAGREPGEGEQHERLADVVERRGPRFAGEHIGRGGRAGRVPDHHHRVGAENDERAVPVAVDRVEEAEHAGDRVPRVVEHPAECECRDREGAGMQNLGLHPVDEVEGPRTTRCVSRHCISP